MGICIIGYITPSLQLPCVCGYLICISLGGATMGIGVLLSG